MSAAEPLPRSTSDWSSHFRRFPRTHWFNNGTTVENDFAQAGALREARHQPLASHADRILQVSTGLSGTADRPSVRAANARRQGETGNADPAIGTAGTVADSLQSCPPLCCSRPCAPRDEEPASLVSVVWRIGAFLVSIMLVLWSYEHPLPEPIPPSDVDCNVLWGGAWGILEADTLESDIYHQLGFYPDLLVGFIAESAELVTPLVFFTLALPLGDGRAPVRSGQRHGFLRRSRPAVVALTALIASRDNIGVAELVLLVRALRLPAGYAAWTALLTGTLGRGPVRHGRAGLTRATLVPFGWQSPGTRFGIRSRVCALPPSSHGQDRRS